MYALPARVVIVSNDGSGTLEISLNGTDWIEIESGDVVGSVFLRSTDDDSTVVLKNATEGFSEEEDMTLESVSVSLTANELQNLNSVDKVLVAPDPLNILVPFRFMLQFRNTVPGSGGIGTVTVRYSVSTTSPMQGMSVDLATTSGIVTIFSQPQGSGYDNQSLLNVGLVLHATAPGDGTQVDILATTWFARFPSAI